MSRLLWTPLFFVVGCIPPMYPHVTLQTPSPEAPIEERAKAYQQVKTDKEKLTETTTTIDVQPIILENGTEVFWLEDLLPLVPSDSKTATRINDALAQYQKGRKKTRQGYAIFVVGGFLFVPSIFIPNRAAAISVGVTGGVLATYGMFRGFSGQLEQISYFTKSTEVAYSLNQDILTKLNLCISNQILVDCNEVK